MLDRRTALLAGASTGMALLTPSAWAGPGGLHTEGTIPPPQSAKDEAAAIINSLPTSDYVAVMEALSHLDTSAPKGPDGLPYNARWPKHANPLLVQMWRDLGVSYIANDCESWCGVAMGWCLQRTGRVIPKDSPSSQAYLTYGTVVTQPAPDDIVVFTNYGDAGHGHVTLFRRWIDDKTLEVLGGNQQLSGGTNCPNGFGISVIDQRPMAKDTKHTTASGKLSGHYVHRFVRPPAATLPPAKTTGPAQF